MRTLQPKRGRDALQVCDSAAEDENITEENARQKQRNNQTLQHGSRPATILAETLAKQDIGAVGESGDHNEQNGPGQPSRQPVVPHVGDVCDEKVPNLVRHCVSVACAVCLSRVLYCAKIGAHEVCGACVRCAVLDCGGDEWSAKVQDKIMQRVCT